MFIYRFDAQLVSIFLFLFRNFKSSEMSLDVLVFKLTFSCASSVIFVVLSCSDSLVSCWSVALINTSWHMIFRRLTVRSHIWLWQKLKKPPFLHESVWSMVKQAPHSQVVGSRCSYHPYRSRSSMSQKQFSLMV